MDHIMRTRVIRNGGKNGSHYVIIPRELCDKLSLVKGDRMDIFSDEDKVVYSKVKA